MYPKTSTRVRVGGIPGGTKAKHTCTDVHFDQVPSPASAVSPYHNCAIKGRTEARLPSFILTSKLGALTMPLDMLVGYLVLPHMACTLPASISLGLR